jgi:hypothetical protein
MRTRFHEFSHHGQRGAFLVMAMLGFLVIKAAGQPSVNLVYPLKISPGKRYLVDQKNAPFLIQGDSPWSLIVGLTRTEAELYLEDRRLKGFNTLMVNLIEHKFKGPLNRDGEKPFSTPGDFSTPNEKYFAHADWVLKKAAEKGIQLLLAPCYLGYKDTDEGWYEEIQSNGTAKCREYGRFLGKRYKDFDNILWLMGGDRSPEKALDEVREIALGISEYDSRHLFSAHCAPEQSAVDGYPGESWLNVNCTYTYEIVHKKIRADYHRIPVMPFFLIESTYEGEHNSTPVQIRRQAYWAILGGAMGQLIGNRPIWLFDPGWQAALNLPGSQDMVHIRSLFLSRSWQDLIPDESHSIVTQGIGEFNGLDYVSAAGTADGGTVIAYLPVGRTITVDMSKVSGSQIKAWWYNPRTGKVEPAGQFPSSGLREFTAPDNSDWVLVLEDSSKEIPPPGQFPSRAPRAKP